MDLKFEKFHEGSNEIDRVVLSPDNVVKYVRTTSRSHISAEPYKKSYKTRKPAINKFLKIVGKIIEDEN